MYAVIIFTAGDEGVLPTVFYHIGVLLFLQLIFVSYLLLFGGGKAVEVSSPTRAEVDMPPPQTAQERLWVGIVLCSQRAVGAP